MMITSSVCFKLSFNCQNLNYQVLCYKSRVLIQDRTNGKVLKPLYSEELGNYYMLS